MKKKTTIESLIPNRHLLQAYEERNLEEFEYDMALIGHGLLNLKHETLGKLRPEVRKNLEKCLELWEKHWAGDIK